MRREISWSCMRTLPRWNKWKSSHAPHAGSRVADMFCNKPNTFVLLVILVVFSSLGYGQTSISPMGALQHIGETATVCGQVASTHYAANSRGTPTFINLDKPHPAQIFTVLIFGDDRPKFGNPEVLYRNKRICVTGKIKSYNGVPEIVAYDPSQITVHSQSRFGQ